MRISTGIGTDFSFHDGGVQRQGFPIAMDAAPTTKPARYAAFTRDDESEPTKPESEKTMTAQQILDAVAAMKAKGMSAGDIVDALTQMGGGAPASATPSSEQTALDRALRRPIRQTPTTIAAREARFPHANRLHNA